MFNREKKIDSLHTDGEKYYQMTDTQLKVFDCASDKLLKTLTLPVCDADDFFGESKWDDFIAIPGDRVVLAHQGYNSKKTILWNYQTNRIVDCPIGYGIDTAVAKFKRNPEDKDALHRRSYVRKNASVLVCSTYRGHGADVYAFNLENDAFTATKLNDSDQYGPNCTLLSDGSIAFTYNGETFIWSRTEKGNFEKTQTFNSINPAKAWGPGHRGSSRAQSQDPKIGIWIDAHSRDGNIQTSVVELSKTRLAVQAVYGTGNGPDKTDGSRFNTYSHLQIWDLEEKKCIKDLGQNFGDPVGMVVTPSGMLLVLGKKRNEICVLDGTTFETVETLTLSDPITSISEAKGLISVGFANGKVQAFIEKPLFDSIKNSLVGLGINDSLIKIMASYECRISPVDPKTVMTTTAAKEVKSTPPAQAPKVESKQSGSSSAVRVESKSAGSSSGLNMFAGRQRAVSMDTDVEMEQAMAASKYEFEMQQALRQSQMEQKAVVAPKSVFAPTPPGGMPLAAAAPTPPGGLALDEDNDVRMRLG